MAADTDGVYTSISEIGDAENISKSYVSRILRLALLAPEIVETIIEGRATRRCWRGWSARCRRVGTSSVGSSPGPNIHPRPDGVALRS
jgi:hypothetical protein